MCTHTGEIINMLEEKGVDFSSLPASVPMDGPYVPSMCCINYSIILW